MAPLPEQARQATVTIAPCAVTKRQTFHADTPRISAVAGSCFCLGGPFEPHKRQTKHTRLTKPTSVALFSALAIFLPLFLYLDPFDFPATGGRVESTHT